MDIAFYQNIWFFIIGFFLIVYSILDGFDLGSGIILPLIAKTNDEKQKVFNSIWPVWDGNEVWLITAGAGLFAAFPYAYATVFSGFYLALILVLVGLIFRAISMEFFYYDEKNKSIWSTAFTIGSFLPSLLFGVALGNIMLGIPIDLNMNYSGTFFTLLRPYPIVIGLLGLTAIILQGTTWISYKIEGEVGNRAKSILNKVLLTHSIFFILSLIVTIIYNRYTMSSIFIWISATLFSICLAYIYISNKNNKSFNAFIASSLSFLFLWIIAGATLYPNLVRSVHADAYNVTIYNASSSLYTLQIMTLIAIIGIPIVITYTIYVYKIFKGKII